MGALLVALLLACSVMPAMAHVRTCCDDAPGKTAVRKDYRKAKQCVVELNPSDTKGCERT